jgi:hypothetical protein
VIPGNGVLFGAPVNVEDLYSQIKDDGYQNGNTIHLSACGVSGTYAAGLSSRANATVIFTSRWSVNTRNQDGSVTKTPNTKSDGTGRNVGWQSITVKGNNVSYTDERGQTSQHTYNSETGHLTQASPETGTRILKSTCVSEKCK